MNGQELDGGYPEALQVLDARGRGQPRVRPPELGRYTWMTNRETPDVHFVDDAAVPRCLRPHVPAPLEQIRHHHALGNAPRVVLEVRAQIVAAGGDRVAVYGGTPVDLAGDRTRVRICQQLRSVEAPPTVRIVQPVRADGVERAGLEPGSVAMPDVRRLLDEWDAPDLPLGLVGIEEADFDALRVRAIIEERDVTST